MVISGNMDFGSILKLLKICHSFNFDFWYYCISGEYNFFFQFQPCYVDLSLYLG